LFRTIDLDFKPSKTAVYSPTILSDEFLQQCLTNSITVADTGLIFLGVPIGTSDFTHSYLSSKNNEIATLANDVITAANHPLSIQRKLGRTFFLMLRLCVAPKATFLLQNVAPSLSLPFATLVRQSIVNQVCRFAQHDVNPHSNPDAFEKAARRVFIPLSHHGLGFQDPLLVTGAAYIANLANVAHSVMAALRFDPLSPQARAALIATYPDLQATINHYANSLPNDPARLEFLQNLELIGSHSVPPLSQQALTHPLIEATAMAYESDPTVCKADLTRHRSARGPVAATLYHLPANSIYLNPTNAAFAFDVAQRIDARRVFLVNPAQACETANCRSQTVDHAELCFSNHGEVTRTSYAANRGICKAIQLLVKGRGTIQFEKQYQDVYQQKRANVALPSKPVKMRTDFVVSSQNLPNVYYVDGHTHYPNVLTPIDSDDLLERYLQPFNQNKRSYLAANFYTPPAAPMFIPFAMTRNGALAKESQQFLRMLATAGDQATSLGLNDIDVTTAFQLDIPVDVLYDATRNATPIQRRLQLAYAYIARELMESNADAYFAYEKRVLESNIARYRSVDDPANQPLHHGYVNQGQAQTTT
jgi:hypothetical protein